MARPSAERRLETGLLGNAFAGTRYEAVRDDFLACLQHPAHRSAARVCMCIGTLANREP